MKIMRVALFGLLLAAFVACGDDGSTSSGGTTTVGDGTTTTDGGDGGGTTTTGGDGIDPLTDADTDAKSGPSTATTVTLLTDVRMARHEGYDRVVLEFGDADGLPQWRAEYVDPPILEDASGEEVEMEGDAFVQIVMQGASGFDMETVTESYTGPDELDGSDFGMSVVQEVERTGDFEAVLTWTIGLSDEVDFRVLTLSGAPRLVLDFRNH